MGIEVHFTSKTGDVVITNVSVLRIYIFPVFLGAELIWQWGKTEKMTPKSARCEGPRVILAPIVFFSWRMACRRPRRQNQKLAWLKDAQNWFSNSRDGNGGNYMELWDGFSDWWVSRMIPANDGETRGSTVGMMGKPMNCRFWNQSRGRTGWNQSIKQWGCHLSPDSLLLVSISSHISVVSMFVGEILIFCWFSPVFGGEILL